MAESNHEIAPSFRAFSRAVSVTVAAIGLSVLAGWILDIQLLKSVFPGLVTMKVNTALGFILVGSSLWLSCRENAGPLSARAGASRGGLPMMRCGCLSL